MPLPPKHPGRPVRISVAERVRKIEVGTTVTPQPYRVAHLSHAESLTGTGTAFPTFPTLTAGEITGDAAWAVDGTDPSLINVAGPDAGTDLWLCEALFTVAPAPALGYSLVFVSVDVPGAAATLLLPYPAGDPYVLRGVALLPVGPSGSGGNVSALVTNGSSSTHVGQSCALTVSATFTLLGHFA